MTNQNGTTSQASANLATSQCGQGNVQDAGDPATMSPPWSNEHCEAAQSEGWDIFATQGSDCGPWQIQRFDDASEYPYAALLATDEQAWEIVRLGEGPHHAAARLFIQAHNPKEWTAVSGNVQEGVAPAVTKKLIL